MVAFLPALIVGNGLTVMLAVETFLQPFTSVPVTVYVVDVVGENKVLSVAPFVHWYVEAPAPISLD